MFSPLYDIIARVWYDRKDIFEKVVGASIARPSVSIRSVLRTANGRPYIRYAVRGEADHSGRFVNRPYSLPQVITNDNGRRKRGK